MVEVCIKQHMSTTTLQHRKQVMGGTGTISVDETESQMIMAHDDTSNIVGNASDGSEMLPTYPSIAYLNPDLCINAPTVVDEEEPRFPVTSSGVHNRRSLQCTDGFHRATITASPPDVVDVASPSGVSAPEPDVAMEAAIPRMSTRDDRGDAQLFAHPSPSGNPQPHFAPFEMSLGSRSHASSRWTWKRRPHFRRTVEITWFRLAVFVIISAILLATAGLLGRYCSRGGASTKSQPQGGEAPGKPTVSTLDSIKARGSLNCGVVANLGFSMFNETTQTWSGFDIDLCRAIGAAVFNNSSDHVIFKNLTLAERFIALQNGEVDVLAAETTYTMERDLYESTAQAGFTFSTPYLYNGLSFAGQPQFVQCADQRNTTGNCSGLTICVQNNTTHVVTVRDLFPGSVIKLAPTQIDFYNNFVQGHCNVLAGEQFDLAAINVRQAGYGGNYSISNVLYSKEPLALVTRDDDVEWSDFVNWVFLALLTAEHQTVSEQTAQNVIENPGPTIDMSLIWSYHAVKAVGNYAEMYDRHLQSMVPRAPVNEQNTGITPLFYSLPFGDVSTVGPGPNANGTLERILQRGELRCGVGTSPFFTDFNVAGQQWSGLDVFVCMAISAAIFNGTGSTRFIQLDPDVRFSALANGDVDVLIRATGINYPRDVSEPSTNVGFTFSAPDIFTGLSFGGIPSYADCANRLDVTSIQCRSLLICVNNATTNMINTQRLFPANYLVLVPSEQAVYECLKNKEANVIAIFDSSEATVRKYYSGPYQEGSKLFSRDNLAPVTRQDDPQWSSFVNWIMHALFYAEEQGITQANYTEMPQVNLFNSTFSSMFQNAIQAVGSYGEIYNRSAGSGYPRSAINHVNVNPLGPQHYPPPGLFGLV